MVNVFDYKTPNFEILKQFFYYDYNIIYEYLIGVNVNTSKVLCMLHSFYNVFAELNFYEENTSNFNVVNATIPKRIALMKELGFYNLDKFKSLTDNEKYTVLGYIFDIDITNRNSKDSLRRNFVSLKDLSNENISKFTASKHVGYVLNEILKK